MSTFEIGQEHFLLDGREHQIISGAMHYFRIHPDQWAQRIATAKAMGLNTIETYVAWNFHAPRRGKFRLDGQRDLARYLSLIQEAGMHAIVRPGPYICAEWDNGGIPAWLLADPEVLMRRDEPRYLAAVQEYLDALLPVVAPLQVDRGGPVLMVQVENEYGAYGEDKVYLRKLADMLREGGITVPLFTCDQADDQMLTRGGLPELHKTATFGSRSLERLQVLRRHQPSGPLMCMEYWNGWFDAWGEDHHVTDPDGTGQDLRELLESGASVNLYMVHGGTNFGFTNGANDKGRYRPTITSYDYDAPMAEDGAPTAKYDAVQDVIRTHRGLPAEPVARRAAAPSLHVAAPATTVALWSLVDRHLNWQEHEEAPTHEQIGALSGFSCYRTQVDLPEGALLTIGEARDRVQVFCNREPVGVLDRAEGGRALALPAGDTTTLELVVEDQGRVNYGPRIGEPKGVIGPVLLDGEVLRGWRAAALPVDEWAASMTSGQEGAPARRTAGLPGPSLSLWRLDGLAAADLFLDTSGLGKGQAWFNGWNLGRYWGKGPQETLYVPAPLVRQDHNALVVLELTGGRDAAARFVAGPRWSTTTAD
ncbi:beta-galactosidase [Georgenia satyanarayanai]|uniref:glycoside hydrolase family 35 protein n=1 Tax=Georgenia satyanarayanai TaxID=860221 RepID=UPI00203CB77F|nr:beta-galactosidase family protein [Georgenia satyanarayanai]MCM3659511.1 beta-galactosidase [Georgenia satyanarayanai]